MPTQSSLKKFIVLTLLLDLAVGSGGCQKFKRILVKPPAEGVTHESYTLRFTGYEQTVTVSASPEALLTFLSDSHSWLNISGTEMTLTAAGTPTAAEPMQLGSSFPFRVKKMGIEASGRMILIKSNPKEMWFVWDNPQMMQVQRWKFEPLKEKTRLTINVMTQSPETVFNKVVEGMGIAEIVCREIDYMLANLQAHFDPALNPDQLVAKGLRGEIFETLFHAQETSVWVNAKMEDAILKKSLALENMTDVLAAGQVEGLGECLEQPENRQLWESRGGEAPVLCPITVQLGGLKWKGDSFITTINPQVSQKPHQDLFVSYGVIAGIVFRFQLTGQAEKGGTQLHGILTLEPPGSYTSNLVDAFVAISGLPAWSERILLEIKAKAEGVGP